VPLTRVLVIRFSHAWCCTINCLNICIERWTFVFAWRWSWIKTVGAESKLEEQNQNWTSRYVLGSNLEYIHTQNPISTPPVIQNHHLLWKSIFSKMVMIWCTEHVKALSILNLTFNFKYTYFLLHPPLTLTIHPYFYCMLRTLRKKYFKTKAL